MSDRFLEFITDYVILSHQTKYLLQFLFEFTYIYHFPKYIPIFNLNFYSISCTKIDNTFRLLEPILILNKSIFAGKHYSIIFSIKKIT